MVSLCAHLAAGMILPAQSNMRSTNPHQNGETKRKSRIFPRRFRTALLAAPTADLWLKKLELDFGKWASIFACGLVFIIASTGKAADTPAALSAWLAAQTNFQTWSADFTQTRSLKSLTQPLIATGHVWFAAPNRFRWELGNPAQTIAVRQPDQMLVIYPRLKRAERYRLTGEQNGPWKDTLALLEAGFPRSQRDLEARFRLLTLATSNEVCELTLQPKSSAARRMMPQIKVAFATNDFSLRATELQFADGSTLRNDFTNAQLNLRLEETIFAPKLEADVKIVEPLKR